MDTDKISTFARTSGDGMENVSTIRQEQSLKQAVGKDSIEKPLPLIQHKVTPNTNSNNQNLPIPGLHTIYRAPPQAGPPQNQFQMPAGKLFLLQPKLIKSISKPEHKKTKTPRFIPFEPYKACVSFLTKEDKLKAQTKIKKNNRNNLDINVLVSQLKKSSEIEKSPEDAINSEFKKLKEERDTLKRQLKLQVQVNSELKNLLVAAVGEDDLHTKVNILTEDKIELARSYNLSTQTEQIEFLIGQCEVWRSKFLATRVIIEELAQWKTALTEKNNSLCDSNKNMLELISQIRELLLEILKNINFLANLKNFSINSPDVIFLTSECLNITQQLVLHSGIPKIPTNLIINTANILTEVEKTAIRSLEQLKTSNLTNQDENFRAIVKQAKRKLSVAEELKD